MEVINAIGRRKAAVARVYLRDGKGQIMINEREYKQYFQNEILQYVVLQPLNLLNVADKFDITVTLDGGGSKGQAEAVRLGISRALIKVDPEFKSNLRLKASPRVIRARSKERSPADPRPARDSSSASVRSSTAIIIDAGLVSKLH